MGGSGVAQLRLAITSPNGPALGAVAPALNAAEAEVPPSASAARESARGINARAFMDSSGLGDRGGKHGSLRPGSPQGARGSMPGNRRHDSVKPRVGDSSTKFG